MITIVGNPNTVRRGIPLNEVGIVVRRFQVRYFPENDLRFGNIVNETIVRSVSGFLSRELSCEGEISGTTGIMAFTLGTALAFANFVADFGPAAGTFLLDDATVTADRIGWRSVAIRASSNPLL